MYTSFDYMLKIVYMVLGNNYIIDAGKGVALKREISLFVIKCVRLCYIL